MTCIPVLPEKFLLWVSASTGPALRQEDKEEETTSRDSHPVWNVKETVYKEDRKEHEETNAPKGYLVTKPSPVRPHSWEHEEGNISSLPVLPPTPSPALPSSSSQ